MSAPFIWADLSCYDLPRAQGFYGSLFGWHFRDYFARLQYSDVAGLFEMPEKFQKIGMPSFWMSYIQVDDLDAKVAQARALGGKVELGPEPFGDDARIALVRDPLGAGFTIYEGPAFSTADGENTRLGHALFVSDARAVMPFYEALFDWRFVEVESDLWQFRAGKSAPSYLYQIADERIRGREEYWAVLFKINDLDAVLENASSLGGRYEAVFELPEGQAALIRDPDEAGFIVVSEYDAQVRRAYKKQTRIMWRTFFFLMFLIVVLRLIWALAL